MSSESSVSNPKPPLAEGGRSLGQSIRRRFQKPSPPGSHNSSGTPFSSTANSHNSVGNSSAPANDTPTGANEHEPISGNTPAPNISPPVVALNPGVTGSSQPSTSVAHEPRSIAWTRLKRALRALRLSTDLCPPLKSAIGELVDCLDVFEVGDFLSSGVGY